MSSTDQPPSQTLVSTSSASVAAHPISALALSPPFLYAASGSQLHFFHFSSSSLSLIHSFPSLSSNPAPIKSIGFSNYQSRHNSKRHRLFVLTAHQDGKIRVWQFKPEHQDKESLSSPSSSAHRLVTVLPTAVDKLQRFTLPRNYVQVRRHKKRLWIHHNDAVSALAARETDDDDEGGLVYSVSWDKCLKVWRGSDFKCLESVTAHEDAVNAVAVSTVDGVVYTGSADGRIRLWVRKVVVTGTSVNKTNRRHVLVSTLEKHKSAVNALALMTTASSNSSVVLFSGACDRSILVWEREVNTGTYNMVLAGALRGHGKAVLCLVTVGDMLLLSGSADRTVRMWRRGMDGKFSCLGVLEGHQKPVKSLQAVRSSSEFNADVGGGLTVSVFSGGLDGEIRLWQVKVPSHESSGEGKGTSSCSFSTCNGT